MEGKVKKIIQLFKPQHISSYVCLCHKHNIGRTRLSYIAALCRENYMKFLSQVSYCNTYVKTISILMPEEAISHLQMYICH